MKRPAPRWLAIACVLCVVPHASHAADSLPFPDMRDSWYLYTEAVAALKDRGIVGGYGSPDAPLFKPQQTINRAEFLKLIFSAKESEGGATGSCFSDVPEDAWFAPFVCAAKRRGIAKGYPDGSFRPEQEVNWAEAIALVTRAYGWEIDERKSERWYAPFIETLDRREVLAAHSYVPWNPLSRERAADLIYRMLQYERGVTFEESPGCKNGDGNPPADVLVNGTKRSFLIHAPTSAHREPTPLLIAFHGRTNSNEQVQDYMRFEREAPEMVVVYPAANAAPGGGFSWAGDGGADTAFFDALVEHIGSHLCIDMNRIYVAGHSLGGWMANSVACLRGGVVRASGTVGGDGIGKGCTGPTAAFIAHNPKDTTPPFASAERERQVRVEENACTWKTSDTVPHTLLCEKHAGCIGGNDVVWCPHTIDIDGRGVFYPHQWPRGTADAIITFFKSLDQ